MAAVKRRKNAFSDGQGRLGLGLVSPTLFVIVVVTGIPILLSIRESLYSSGTGEVNPETGMMDNSTPFVGLDNFIHVFSNSKVVAGNWGHLNEFTNAFVNTTLFTVFCVLTETILGVIMALIMNKAFLGRGIVRAGILVPWAIPTIVSALMWKLIFDSDGIMNRVLGHQFLWLADNGSSFVAVYIMDVWKTAPYIGLLTLAGLQTIPAEVYEAGKVDGASAWQQFWRITLPMVKPTLVVAVLFRTLDTLRMFDAPYGMIGLGKYHVETLTMFAFTEIEASRYGSAAAYSIVLFLYIMLIAFLFVRVLGADVINDPDIAAMKAKRRRDRAAGKSGKGGPPPMITSGAMP